ncbi:IclR family transcriptional regulator [Pseudoalteromonas sp. BSi20495]|uniref:IclR family transcriptional regulator n=1 Tax=Pseudoalteromonas sp. BSi20495 TaxID=386429 RepID=UPI0002315B4F|nr:IclR family transcriptional regulator [Pseudoalteromonas sp. BSi20495]GAA79960.1 IclR family transcriptional regulator [Pseudoalteromonas sp. BSi20495]
MNDKSKAKYAVPALDKGLDILEFLALNNAPCTQSEIASGISRTPNEVYRVLVGLEKRGYLVRSLESGRYCLSLKLYNLSRSISPMDNVLQSALPHMEDLAVNSGQSCHLSMLYQSQAMVVVQARSKSPMHLSIAEGALFTLSSSSAGKVLLSNSNDEVRQMLIEHDETYSAYENECHQLLNELDLIKVQGYLVQNNPLIAGVHDFSVLIGKPNAKLIAALTISSFDSALNTSSNKQCVIDELKSTAQKITSLLAR